MIQRCPGLEQWGYWVGVPECCCSHNEGSVPGTFQSRPVTPSDSLHKRHPELLPEPSYVTQPPINIYHCETVWTYQISHGHQHITPTKGPRTFSQGCTTTCCTAPGYQQAVLLALSSLKHIPLKRTLNSSSKTFAARLRVFRRVIAAITAQHCCCTSVDRKPVHWR